MSIVLESLAVLFPVFCLWLAVRIFNRNEPWARRTAKRVAVGVVVGTILYPISLGPACWIVSFTGVGSSVVSELYYPLIDCSMSGPPRLADSLDWWMHLLRAREWQWFNDTGGQFDFVSDR
jgi:hypothetical protein